MKINRGDKVKVLGRIATDAQRIDGKSPSEPWEECKQALIGMVGVADFLHRDGDIRVVFDDNVAWFHPLDLGSPTDPACCEFDKAAYRQEILNEVADSYFSLLGTYSADYFQKEYGGRLRRGVIDERRKLGGRRGVVKDRRK